MLSMVPKNSIFRIRSLSMANIKGAPGSGTMHHIDALEEFVVHVTGQIAQCNFDKAKDLCKREKTLPNGAYREAFNLLPIMINAEKCYTDLGFMQSRSKALVKKDNALKSAFADLKLQCEKLESTEDTEYDRILQEITNYCQIRCQMIDVYDYMYSFALMNKHWKMLDLISNLETVMKGELASYTPKSLVNIKSSIETEILCLFDLLNAQYHLENWNLLSCISVISSVKSRLQEWEKTIHNKETWKVSFLTRNSLPELYRWMTKFKTFILEKVSLYFYTIIQQQTSASDIKTLCSKHHLEFLQRFQTLSKKFGHEATGIMLIFDACGMKNWYGPGYRCPLRKNKSESPSSSYCVMVKHPEKLGEVNKLMPTIKKILVEHFSDILFLEKVVCRYFAEDNSTFFLTSIEERISLVAYYNSKKDDRQADIDNFMLELACTIRCHRIFLGLNPSGR